MEKISLINTIEYAMNPQSSNPFQEIGTHRVLFDPEWVGYMLGGLLLVLGIACFFFYPKTRDKAIAYKKSQLDAFNKKYNKKETQYEKTGMYLPMGQRAMMFLPVVIGIVFCVIGIAFITTQTIFSL